MFDGRDVLGLSESAMMDVRGEKISLVFQDPMTSQSPVLSYARQMTDVLYRRRGMGMAEKRARAVEMMRRVGIPDPESRIAQYPHQFSGGMRQRAGIAMALLMDPMLLIADEPTTALDVTMEAQIIHLIRELRRELEATIVVVSHNLGLIAELCDEVVVMYAGEVVETGGVREIFHRAAHPYTRALLECDPARERPEVAPSSGDPGRHPRPAPPPAGCVFAARCGLATDLCRERQPASFAVSADGHAARCHRLEGSLPVSRSSTARFDAVPGPPFPGSVGMSEGGCRPASFPASHTASDVAIPTQARIAAAPRADASSNWSARSPKSTRTGSEAKESLKEPSRRPRRPRRLCGCGKVPRHLVARSLRPLCPIPGHGRRPGAASR